MEPVRRQSSVDAVLRKRFLTATTSEWPGASIHSRARPTSCFTEPIMSTTRRFTTVALAMLLGAGLLASPVHAELPKEPRNVAVMDANKDGKIDRDEYLDYMGTQFDKRAGTKGYCTFEEVSEGAKDIWELFGRNYPGP